MLCFHISTTFFFLERKYSYYLKREITSSQGEKKGITIPLNVITIP